MVGRTGRTYLACVVLVAAAAGTLAYGARYEAAAGAALPAPRGDTLLSHVATGLAGKPVAARCPSASEWPRAVAREVAANGRAIAGTVLGFATVGGDWISLSPRVCAQLHALASGATPTDVFDSASALVTLAHESWHAHGVAPEAVAECRAIQTATTAAHDLGVNTFYARLAIELYWSRYGEELPEYRSPECRDGGGLDLHPRSAVWP